MTSIRDMMKEPVKPKRNFLKENKGLIHKIEEQNRAKRNNIVDVPKNKKYSNVQSKVHAIIHGTGSDKAGRVTWEQNVNKERITEDPLRVPKNYQRGVVPRYLRVRHEEQAREAERAIREAKDPDCPPGHRKLTLEEQKESLEKLKTTQNELLVQLNRLPVQLHTLRAQNQRRMLDEELDKVERLIVAFSKPKVFVELPTDTG
ncbi:hypothetical protein B566_EDAN006759 [Ephemera danica]|nr:hypothetical protein B566_EDAN006759 [Ephemera danica]